MKINLTKVTIIGESLLKEGLLKLIKNEGSTGHTITMCEGEGSRGIHASDWEGRNIQIETIVSADTAERILDAVSDKYMKNYAIIAYLSQVVVLRGGKFDQTSED
jgi:nitrogen regulatory protein P-II 2